MAFNKKETRATVVCDNIIQISLLPEHVDEAVSRKITFDKASEEIDNLVLEGYSLLIQYDREKTQWSARLAGVYADLTNAKKLLYGNGITKQNAIMSLWIKVFLVSRGGVWVGITPSSLDMS